MGASGVLPSPLVGEGGANERSSFATGEGSVSADRDPSSAFAFAKAPSPTLTRVYPS